VVGCGSTHVDQEAGHSALITQGGSIGTSIQTCPVFRPKQWRL